MEDELIAERYELSMERIRSFSEESVREPFRGFFLQMAEFVQQTDAEYEVRKTGAFLNRSLEELQRQNHALYADILPEHYEESYANPEYAARVLGAEYGPLLAAFYAQLRGGVVFAAEGRLYDMTILAETLIELYNLFEGELPAVQSVRDVLYWFFSDYTDVTLPDRLREQMDPGQTFAKNIVMESDLADLRYLYRFGEYISGTELSVARFLNSLPQDTVETMARIYTEGFRKGFEVMRRDLSGKKTVVIRYELGFERMVREAVKQFRAMGLEPVIYRAAVWLTTKTPGRQVGYHGTSPNRQYDYDHRYDQALFFDRAFKNRKLDVLKAAYEKYREMAAQYAGPAVIETFGQKEFRPVNKPEALALTSRQEEAMEAYTSESMPVVNCYIPGDETSFTIIAFPVPEIGEPYEEIFREIIRINSLDYGRYLTIQQHIIDVLDQAETVHVTGRDGNETDMTVHLHHLEDPSSQTNFENCVADVNIPVGEVFTSPVLAGTNGLLHVKKVCIGSILYRDLRIRFEDGRVTDYSCRNFEDPEQGRALVRQEILKNHDWLPMGEFAVGTNTTAYAAAQRYGIADKLPILIAEKTGPHFAAGDTCYSWSEDSPMYNPDGREVIARDNEISLLRKTDPQKAYFGCHTDITIPYSELGDICAVTADGRRLPVILGGRFAAEGTEELNGPLEEL